MGRLRAQRARKKKRKSQSSGNERGSGEGRASMASPTAGVLPSRAAYEPSTLAHAFSSSSTHASVSLGEAKRGEPVDASTGMWSDTLFFLG